MAEDTENKRPKPSGIGVDSSGNPVIDPTANVRELVLAESKRIDGNLEAHKALSTMALNSLRELFAGKADQLNSKVDAIEKLFDDRVRESEVNRNAALAQAAKNIQDGLDKAERLLTTALSAAEIRVNASWSLALVTSRSCTPRSSEASRSSSRSATCAVSRPVRTTR